jgi:hypothetical protein
LVVITIIIIVKGICAGAGPPLLEFYLLIMVKLYGFPIKSQVVSSTIFIL